MKKPTKSKKHPAPQDPLIPVKSTGSNKLVMSQMDPSVMLTDWSNLCPQTHSGLAAYAINKSSKSSADLFKKIYMIYKATELSKEQYSFIVKLLLYALSSESCTQIFQPHSKSYLAILSILINDKNIRNFANISPSYIEIFSKKVSQFYEQRDRYYYSIYILCMADHASVRQSNELSILRKYITAYNSQQADMTKDKNKQVSEKIIAPSGQDMPSCTPRVRTNLKKLQKVADSMNSNIEGKHIRKSCLIQPKMKNSIWNSPPMPKHASSIKKAAFSRPQKKENGIVKFGKGAIYSTLSSKALLHSIREDRAKTIGIVSVPVNQKTKHVYSQSKYKNIATTSKQNALSISDWEKLQPRYPTEPVIKHSTDFSYDKFREYSEARENQPKEDLGMFSELHDSSFLKQRGYDTNTTWEKRKQILESAHYY